jgi:hypothetical protein
MKEINISEANEMGPIVGYSAQCASGTRFLSPEPRQPTVRNIVGKGRPCRANRQAIENIRTALRKAGATEDVRADVCDQYRSMGGDPKGSGSVFFKHPSGPTMAKSPGSSP